MACSSANILLDKKVGQVYNSHVPLRPMAVILKGNEKEQTDVRPALPIGVTGSYAADVCEPRQVCEEATVSVPLWVS